VDVATIDQEYTQLQQESLQLTQGIQAFAQKLQAAGDAGDAQAKEWILDLKSTISRSTPSSSSHNQRHRHPRPRPLLRPSPLPVVGCCRAFGEAASVKR
jgi:hypothetical protein